jgi:superfamily II DNA or RNA helicase
MNKITPENILEFVKFNIEDKDWKYDANHKDLYAYQAEGAAGIINRLDYNKLAILADEVGMGKTFQALAVVAKQFKDKSDSRILITTPRFGVLRQWKNQEYEQFRNHHLFNPFNLPPLDDVGELSNLANGFIPDEKCKIIFAKTTSFSQNINIEQCQSDIKKFDLVIIDKAHQYRNYHNDYEANNRTTNAEKIFESTPEIKILLMTATPLHSSKNDIFNIVSVFKKSIIEPNDNAQNIMKKFMVRRLRVMAKNYNKYHYRYEQDIEVGMQSQKDDYKNELFFAMLQREIIHSLQSIDYSKSKNLLDLLEGTTFDDDYIQANSIDDEDKSVKNEFNKIVKSFKELYGDFPSNQKYIEVLKKIYADNEKALVFVRRRASAVEFVRHYIEDFDKKAWGVLTDGNHEIPARNGFDKIILKKSIDDKKFNQFIQNSEVNIFLIDYRAHFETLHGKHSKTVLKHMADYYFSLYDDFSENDFNNFKKEFKDEENSTEQLSGSQSKVLDFFKTKRSDVSTSASRFIRKFENGRIYENFFKDFLPNKLNYTKHQNKFGLIKSAVLHASFGVVELFKCELNSSDYKSFCDNTEKILDQSIFKKEIEEFIKYFDKFEKHLKFNQNTQKEDKDAIIENENQKNYDESIFYNAQPAYAYLANTKNEGVIARFNSPFFPNLLCGTSTLQEGLNLHLFCNKVYHFGSAHSMGDDEQRTGRVDRIHGKMFRELEADGGAKLNILYPYLHSTFDEENLRNMLCSKRATEKKIDKCTIQANIDDKKYFDESCNKSIKDLVYQKEEQSNNQTEPFGWILN